MIGNVGDRYSFPKNDAQITLVMLIIHPQDRTTAFLAALYEGVEGATIVTENVSRKEMNHLLHHRAKEERIMLLGHGCGKGLYWRNDDTKPNFDGIIVGHPHAFHLRQHCNIVAVFCHADEFAKTEGLHGIFTGMIISEMSEALEYGVETTPEELECENAKFVARLRSLLDAETPLHEIPARMLVLDDTHSSLTRFNYQHIYYI